MPKRILYIVGESPSITETFVDREIRGLRALGLDIAVFPLSDNLWTRCGAAALPRARSLSRIAGTLRRDTFRPTWRRTLSAALRAAEIACLNAECDHIHAHFLGLPATVALCVARLLGKPYSLTAHAHDIFVETTPETVVREALFRTTCTEGNLRHLRDRYPDLPFFLVRHGLDPGPYARPVPFAARPLCRILAVGRLVEKKGFSHLIEAFHLLKGRPLQWRATIVGEGPLRANLDRLIAEHGLAHHVTLTGFKAHGEVTRLLHDADIVVAPSVVAQDGDRDGVPNILLEAMAARVPVVTTDAGAITEVVSNRETGRLVEQRNPRALAAAIEELWWNPRLREDLAEAAHQRLCRDFEPVMWNLRLFNLFMGVAEPERSCPGVSLPAVPAPLP